MRSPAAKEVARSATPRMARYLSACASAIGCRPVSGLQQHLLGEEGDQVLAVGGRGMHIGRRRWHPFGGCFTSAAGTLIVDRIANQEAFCPDQADWSIAHAEGDQ